MGAVEQGHKELGERLASVEASTKNHDRDIAEGERWRLKIEAKLDQVVDSIGRIGKPNSGLMLGVLGVMIAGLVPLAGLLYWAMIATNKPMETRLTKIETQTDSLIDRQWDDFELLIRLDQAMQDNGIKNNEMNHVLQGKKHQKKKSN